MVIMKSTRIILASLALAFVLLAVSVGVAAETVSLHAGESKVVQVDADAGQWLTYTWYTMGVDTLHFVVTDPDGIVIDDIVASSGGDTIFADAGTYTFTWTNTGATSVTLSYTMPFQDIESAVNYVLWLLLVIVMVVVVVIVIVVVLATRKKKAPAAQPLSPMEYQAVASGRCPKCGRPVDPNGMFCAVCGAKLR